MPNRINEDSNLLASLLQQQIDLVNRHIDYLESIKQCLSVNDIERLNSLLTGSTPEAEGIENCRQQQDKLLVQNGYAASEQGIQQFIHDSGRKDLADLKTLLLQRSEKLQQSLLINDLLVRKNRQRIKQSISILSGHGMAPAASTYSRQGNMEDRQKTRRSLALA